MVIDPIKMTRIIPGTYMMKSMMSRFNKSSIFYNTIGKVKLECPICNTQTIDRDREDIDDLHQYTYCPECETPYNRVWGEGDENHVVFEWIKDHKIFKRHMKTIFEW